jgi:CheY-like chemotaxis protein
MPTNPRKILAAVDDLFFIVKINEAAKRAGMSVEFTKTEQDAVDKAVAERPALIVVDLNAHSIRPVNLISTIKAAGLKGVSLIAFVQHVQGELKQQAQEAGADMVMARSAFSISLPDILKRHARQVA